MLEVLLTSVISNSAAAVTKALMATAAGCYLASLWAKTFCNRGCPGCEKDD